MEKDEKIQNPDSYNEYEAVLVAAKLARKINDKRMAQKQQLAVEDYGKIDQRKATSVAMDLFKKGEVKYSFKKPTDSEDESLELT